MMNRADWVKVGVLSLGVAAIVALEVWGLKLTIMVP